MAYTIYKKNGQERLTEIEVSLKPNAGRFVEPQLEYNGTWMGECFVTLNIKSPVPIKFAIGDYVMYRGEKFVINYDPSVIKKATKKSTGDAFCYDNVKFSALSYELSDIRMLDYVIDGNNIHWNGLPRFSVFCPSIEEFADRLQANTDRWCHENGIGPAEKWFFITPTRSLSVARAASGEVSSSDKSTASDTATSIYVTAFDQGTDVDDAMVNQNVSIDNMTVWDAMKYIKETFGLNFIVRGRAVIIGAAGIPVDGIFQYGKDNGLYEIERVADSEQQIITKLFAYGTDKNLPTRYYADLSGGDLPNNLAVNALMLPGFPSESLYSWVKNSGVTTYNDETGYATWHGFSAFFSKNPQQPYIQSINSVDRVVSGNTIPGLGIREATKYFDGSDGTEEVYPSITAFNTNTVYSAQVIEDAGVFPAGQDVADFTITLSSFGANDFVLSDYITAESAISMLDGSCGGRDFQIVSATQDSETLRWTLTCHRVPDESLDLWFPYSDGVAHGGSASANELYQIHSGDHFVFVGIEMPTQYVEAASERLLEGALQFLAKNDATRYTYIPKVDEIYMARQSAEAEQSEDIPIHDKIKEGGLMLFEDTDLLGEGNTNAVFIDTLRIKEYGNQQIPTYEVTLRNEKQVGTIQRIQEQIGKITSGETSIGGGTGGSVNIPLVKSLIQTYGTDLFLRKDKESTAAEIIRFLKGIKFGSSNQWYINGDGEAVLNSLNVDNLNALNAHFAQLIIDEIKSVGGMVILTPSNAKVYAVQVRGSSITRLYFKAYDGERRVYQSFITKDQVLCATFNTAGLDGSGNYNVSNKFYWTTVYNVSSEPVEYEGALCHWIGVYSSSAKYTRGVFNPEAGDEITLLGNSGTSDAQKARRNAIVISAYDIDWLDTGYGNPQDSDYIPKLKAPFIVQYAGINDFNLYNKRVNVISHGYNVFKGDFKANTGEDLMETISQIEEGRLSFVHQAWAANAVEDTDPTSPTYQGWTLTDFNLNYFNGARFMCMLSDHTQGEAHLNDKSIWESAPDPDANPPIPKKNWVPFNYDISSVDYYYAKTTTGDKPADSAFSSSYPSDINAKDYIWTKEVITYSNGLVSTSYSSLRIADDGEAGAEGVSSYLHIAYASSADGSQNFSTTPLASSTYIGFYRNEEQLDPSGPTAYTLYTWSKYVGDDGLNGLSAIPDYIPHTEVHHLATNMETGVKISTPGWDVDTQLTDEKPYLWRYDHTYYTSVDGIENYITKYDNGPAFAMWLLKLHKQLVNGEKYSLVIKSENLMAFNNITGVNIYISHKNAGTENTRMQASNVQQLDDNTIRLTFSANVMDGKVQELILVEAIPEGSGKKPIVPSGFTIPHLEWCTLVPGETFYSYAPPVATLESWVRPQLISKFGRGVSGVTEQYARNNSNTTPPETWGTDNTLMPTASQQYVWNREIITYTDGQTEETDAHVILTYFASKKSEVIKYAVTSSSSQPADSAFASTTNNIPPTVNIGQYLWVMTETTYADNSKSRSYTVSYKGTNGTSPIYADIDNEMDSIACTSAGKPSSAQTVSTTVSFYFGSTRQNCKITGVKRNGTAMTTGTAVSGITPTFPSAAGSTRTLSLAYSTSATVSKDTYEITVTDSNGNNSRTLYFVVNGIKAGANGTNGTNGADGEDAVLYRLVPSVSSIIQKKDLTYSVANVSCTRQKSVGGTITNNTTEGTITYKIDGGSETSYTNNTNIAVSGITKNIQFIYKIGGTTVDIETIPLVADGIDGTNPIYADIDNEMDSIACTTAGVPTSAQTVSTKVSMWNGSTKVSSPTIRVYDNTTSGAAYTSGTAKNGITATWSASTGSISFAFATSVAAFTKKVFCITVSKSINGTTETRELYFTVNGIRPGANGTNGTNAVIYNIVPEKDSINVARDGSAYVPANVSITCGYVKNDGGTATKVNDVSSRIDSKYNLYFRRRTRSNQTWESYFYLYTNTTYKAYVTSLNVATYDAVEFVLSTATASKPAAGSIGTVIDRETVPIVSDGEEGNGIKKVTVTYAGSTSGTTAPSSGWQSTVPSVALGSYLWTRTVTTYTDTSAQSTTAYSVSRVGADGSQGTPGAKGADGKTRYFHSAYSNSADGTVNFSPTPFDGATYYGTCSDLNEADPTTPSSYEWVDLKPLEDSGVYIVATHNYYMAHSSKTGVTPLPAHGGSTSGWVEVPPGAMPAVTDAKPYLWNYEVTEYGSNTPNLVLKASKYDNGTATGADPHLFRFALSENLVAKKDYSFSMKVDAPPSGKHYELRIANSSGSVTTAQTVGQNATNRTYLTPDENGIIKGTFKCNLGSVTGTQSIFVSLYPSGGSYTKPVLHALSIVKGTAPAAFALAPADMMVVTTPHVVNGDKGDSTWVADLTNEMDGVQCDDTGYVVSSQSVSTALSLFYGKTEKNFGTPTVKRNGTAMTIGTASNGVTATYSSKVLTIAYTTAAKINGKDTFSIVMTASDDSTVVRTLTFTVNGVKGDVYNLLPKDQNINATRDASGNYLVNGSSTVPLTCGYTKNVNGTITVVENLETLDIDGKYRIFFRLRRRSDKKWQLFDSTKTPTTNYETGNPLYVRFYGANGIVDEYGTSHNQSTVNINTYDAVEFVISAGGYGNTQAWAPSNIGAIDSETIYVVADGVNGTKGDFKSTVFKRQNTQPATPTGGTYDSPVPSGWSDGIPAGGQMVWASTRVFKGNGSATTWTTPRQMTDTMTYDVEFAYEISENATPVAPNENNSHKDASPYGYEGQIWFDPAKDKYSAQGVERDFTTMAWRAERECVNGVWGSWTIVRMKGEKGDTGAKGATGATGAKGDKGDKGATGAAGKGIANGYPKEYYLISNVSTGVTRSTSGWTESIQTPTEDKPYLWNYEETKFTDNTMSYGVPHVVTTYTRSAAGNAYISGVYNWYVVTAKSSGVTRANPADGTWVKCPPRETPVPTAQKRYLWNYEETVWDAPEQGRNLIKSYTQITHWLIAKCTLSTTTLTIGATYTASIRLTVPANKTYVRFSLYGKINGGTSNAAYNLTSINVQPGTQTVTASFAIPTYTSLVDFRVYCGASGVSSDIAAIDWVKLEKGALPTPYSEAPENLTTYTDPHVACIEGESAFTVDLDNEMSAVALDENGKVESDFSITFKPRAYYGTNSVLQDSTITATCSNQNVTVNAANAKTTGIVVSVLHGVTLGDVTDVVVTVANTAHGTKTTTFTLAGVKAGKNAVIQELLPSLDAISFNRDASTNALSPASRSLTISIKKTAGGTTSTQTIAASGLTIRWSASSMPSSKTGGNAWGSGTATGITWSSNTMTVANTVTASNIYVACFNSGGTLVDRETIPVIKDGVNGENGADSEVYMLSPIEEFAGIQFKQNEGINSTNRQLVVGLSYDILKVVGASYEEVSPSSDLYLRLKLTRRNGTSATVGHAFEDQSGNPSTIYTLTTAYTNVATSTNFYTVELVKAGNPVSILDTRVVYVTYIASAAFEIDQKLHEIRSIVQGSSFDGKGGLQNDVSQIRQDADEIESTVRQHTTTLNGIPNTYATKSSVTQTASSIVSKVQNQMLNGANLLINSKDQTSGFNSSSSSAYDKTQTNTYYACYYFGADKPTAGDTFTVSWKQTNATGATKYRLYLFTDMSSVTVSPSAVNSDSNGYYSVTVSLAENFPSNITKVAIYVSSGTPSTLANVEWAKAEYGTTASAWNPNISETGSEISQTANEIRMQVENVGININNKQITLNGNTQVNGTLKLDGSGDGFQLLSNTGTALITPESIGTYTDFQQANKVTINPNFTGVKEYIRENGYYRMGMSTQTKELGTFDAGSQIEVTHCSAQIYLYQNGYSRLTGTISGTISFYENNVLKETKTFPYTGTYTTQTTGDVKVLIDPVPTFFTVRQSGTGVPQAEADSYDLMDAAYYAGNPNALWMIYMTFRVPVPGAYVRVASDGVGVKTSNGNTAYFGPSGMHISPLLQNVTKVTTTNYSASVNDDVIIVSSSSSSAVSITLPTGGGIPEGKVIYVKNVGQASTCNVWAVGTSGSGSSSPRIFAHDSNTASSSVNIGKKMSFFISFDTGSGIGWLQGYCST